MARTLRGVPYLALPACLGLELATASAQEPLPEAEPKDESWIEVVWPGQRTPEGDYLRVGGHVAVEGVNWDRGNEKHDGLQTEAFSVLLSGRLGESDFYADIDLDGENTRHNLREAWLEHPLGADHWVRAGWLRTALSSEFATREQDLPVVGYGFTSWQNGRFGPGVGVDGFALPWFWWSATLTAGYATDLAGDQVDEPGGTLRLLAVPPSGALEGLFAGVAWSRTTRVDGPVHVETPFEQAMFVTDDLQGDHRAMFAWEMGYRRGSFRAGVEKGDGTIEGVDLPGGGEESYNEITGYSVFVAWNARGPAPLWSRGRWLPYDLGPGDALPLEFAVRYSNADIDRDFFTDGLATFGPSVNEARTITGTISLYLQRTTRLAFAILDTVSDQPSNNWGGDSDFSWLVRLDQRF